MKSYYFITGTMILLFFGTASTAAAQTHAERPAVHVHYAGKERVHDRVERRHRRRIHRRVHRRAHNHYRHLPALGLRVHALPHGTIILRHHAHTYHFVKGVYYVNKDNTWVVARPLPGLRLSMLPESHEVISINNKTYYYYFGTFYRENGNAYEVTEAPGGAQVRALPDGYEVIEIDGNEYYKLGEELYAEGEDETGEYYEVQG